jgi:hypothetical protein
MLSLVTPARAAARSWAMTAATAASIAWVSPSVLGQPGAPGVLPQYTVPDVAGQLAIAQRRLLASAAGAASIVQQCIRAGLLDEIHVDLVPVLLGGGVGLFDHLGTGPIDLEITSVIEGAGVTHLTYRVLK